MLSYTKNEKRKADEKLFCLFIIYLCKNKTYNGFNSHLAGR